MLRLILLAALVVLACSLSQTNIPATAQAAIEMTQTALAKSPIILTATPNPTSTPTLTPTEGSSPTPTTPALAVPTVGVLPQQWNGVYTYATGERQHLSLLIEKVDGTAFKGKMIWQSFGRFKGAILKMNGEYVTDFGDQVERAKWKNLEDYSEVHTEGTWLKWTETEMISGAYYTVNGWYYGHIREDGTMVAVYFFNKDETIADSGRFRFELVTR